MSEVKVPELAESISEGTISEWLKSVGDQVEQGENIVELETDKVNVEVISEVSGVLSEIKAEEGDTVEVGSVIAIVSEGESGSTSSEQKESDDSKSKDSKNKQKQLKKALLNLKILNKLKILAKKKLVQTTAYKQRHQLVNLHVKKALI